MASLADLVELVIGVDTHKHTHAAAAALVAMADRHSGLRAWAIEGTGSYGARPGGFPERRGRLRGWGTVGP